MKKLLTVNDIKEVGGAGKKVIYLEPGTIITPAARDAAAEWGIQLKNGPEPVGEACCQVREEQQVAVKDAEGPTGLQGIDPALIAKIVQEVMASLPGGQRSGEIVKEADSSGIRLVRGDSVECDVFDTGNPNDKVGLREIFTRKESPNMATGFMTMEKSSFAWTLGYEEIDYIIDGTLDIIINGKTYRGKAGDVFYIPKDTNITFSTPDKVKFFFVTYPANWADLSNK